MSSGDRYIPPNRRGDSAQGSGREESRSYSNRYSEGGSGGDSYHQSYQTDRYRSEGRSEGRGGYRDSRDSYSGDHRGHRNYDRDYSSSSYSRGGGDYGSNRGYRNDGGHRGYHDRTGDRSYSPPRGDYRGGRDSGGYGGRSYGSGPSYSSPSYSSSSYSSSSYNRGYHDHRDDRDRGDRGGYYRRDGPRDNYHHGGGRDYYSHERREFVGSYVHKLLDVNPDNQGGLIIGKRGDTVKKLQANHNVKVTVPAKGSGEPITVVGEKFNVERCVNDIYDILKIPHVAEKKNGRINMSGKLVIRLPDLEKAVVVQSAGGLITGEENDINNLAEALNTTLWIRRNSKEFATAIKKMAELYEADIHEPELPHPKHRPKRVQPEEYKALNEVLVHAEIFCVRAVPVSHLAALLKGDLAPLTKILHETISIIEDRTPTTDTDPQAGLDAEYFGEPDLHRLFQAFGDEHSNLKEVLQNIPAGNYVLVGVEPATFKDAYLYHYYSKHNPEQPKPPKYQLCLFHGRCRANNNAYYRPEDNVVDIVRKTMWSGALREISEESNLSPDHFHRYHTDTTPVIIAPFPHKSSITRTATAIFVIQVDHSTTEELLESLKNFYETSTEAKGEAIQTRIKHLTFGKA